VWFLGHGVKDALGDAVTLYRGGVEQLRGHYRDLLSPEQLAETDARIQRFTADGVPDDIARDIGLLPLLAVAPEIARLAGDTGHGLATVATLYFGLGARIGLDRLRLLASRITAGEHWDRLAIRRLSDDLFAAQRAISQTLLADMAKSASPADAASAIDAWANAHQDALTGTRDFLASLEMSGELSIAKLTLASSQVHKLSDI
jgi:glutamate dehydrogenase